MKFHFIEPELDLNRKIPKTASYIRKEFSLSGKIKKATAYFTACGIYKAYINGREVDHQVLLPGNTSYAHRLQYQQYDVTTYLQEGANAVAAVVGEGWYRGKVGFLPTFGEEKKLKFMCHLEIDMEDGTAVTLDTDLTWRATQDGPIGENDLKAGEHYDARKEFAGWTIAGFDDSKWHEVRKGQYAGALVPCEGERILEQERFSPKEILHTPDGSYLKRRKAILQTDVFHPWLPVCKAGQLAGAGKQRKFHIHRGVFGIETGGYVSLLE